MPLSDLLSDKNGFCLIIIHLQAEGGTTDIIEL